MYKFGHSLILQNHVDILKLGRDLHLKYCLTRRSPNADETLNKISDPCSHCQLRCISLPAKKGKQISREFTPDELKVLKHVFLDYANFNLEVQIPRGEYRSASFWAAILDTYNSRCQSSWSRDKIDDMILGGHELSHEFNKARAMGVIPQDLKRIFERCQECRHRIPVFPTTLMTSQNGSFSYTTGNFSHRVGSSSYRTGNSSYGEEAYVSSKSMQFVVDRTNEINFDRSSKIIDALSSLVESNLLSEDEAAAGVRLCASEWDIHFVATLLNPNATLKMKKKVVLPSIRKAMEKEKAEAEAEAAVEKFAAMAKGKARVRSTQ